MAAQNSLPGHIGLAAAAGRAVALVPVAVRSAQRRIVERHGGGVAAAAVIGADRGTWYAGLSLSNRALIEDIELHSGPGSFGDFMAAVDPRPAANPNSYVGAFAVETPRHDGAVGPRVRAGDPSGLVPRFAAAVVGRVSPGAARRVPPPRPEPGL